MGDDLGPWAPLSVVDAADLFEPATFRWWISGGHALELFAGHSWRAHHDLDVGVCRADAPALPDLLRGWDLQVAAAGRLTPWRGERLDAGRHQNNVWCRTTPSSPWCVDVTVGEGDDEQWVYRRDPSLRIQWNDAVVRTDDGVPFIAPELQLLFKSTNVRPKDELDFREVIGALATARRERLAAWLPAGHPWRAALPH